MPSAAEMKQRLEAARAERERREREEREREERELAELEEAERLERERLEALLAEERRVAAEAEKARLAAEAKRLADKAAAAAEAKRLADEAAEAARLAEESAREFKEWEDKMRPVPIEAHPFLMGALQAGIAAAGAEVAAVAEGSQARTCYNCRVRGAQCIRKT